MSTVEIAVLVVLALIIIEQIGAVLLFTIVCRLAAGRPASSYCPKALVVLPVRGADPSLAQCIRGIAAQDYPDYRVKIVVDSALDPACQVVEDVLRQMPAEHVQLIILENPRTTCTLKCSAVYEATEKLAPDIKVVATIDSDISPHRSWLQDLVAPLGDPRVGATMGNRWYAPPAGRWGSLICYLWNAAVVVSMYFNRVPWGGSLALDADILRTSDLRERWLKAGCEDLPLFAVLRRLRRRLHFVPTQLMISREEYSLSACLRFINRQFVWTRLYHPIAWWGGAVLYGITSVALVLAAGLGAYQIVQREYQTGITLLLVLGLYFLVEAALLIWLEMLVRRLVSARQESRFCRITARLLLAIFAAQALTPLMFLRSLLTRRIVWRGIAYDIHGRWRIRMEQYHPCQMNLPVEEQAADSWQSKVVFPNVLSRVLLKSDFERQFIIPRPPSPLIERLLVWYERSCMHIDLTPIAIDRPIFLVGLHRSGTTLLQDLLCLHPQLGYINNAMPSYRKCFCAAEHLRKRLKLDFKGERMLGDSVEIEAGTPNEGVAFWREWLKEDHHCLDYVPRTIQDFSDQEIAQIRAAIRRILWCFEGRASRFFCKNPSLLPHLELLKDLFPDAKFIHVVRDARSCANSMVKLYRLEQAQLERIRATGGHGIYDDQPYVAFPRLPRLAEYVRQYGADSIHTTARLWNDAIDEIARVKHLLPAFYEVRYEDVLAAPVEQLKRILEFCELTPISMKNERFWKKISEVGKVHHSNQYAHYELIEQICAANLIRYGYQLQRDELPAARLRRLTIGERSELKSLTGE